MNWWILVFVVIALVIGGLYLWARKGPRND